MDQKNHIITGRQKYMHKNDVKPLKLAGLLNPEDKTEFLFTLKVATAMIYSRNLGKQERKSNELS